MKDYHKEAIASGKAIDAYAHPQEVKEYIENQIGYMRKVYSDIDKVVDRYVNAFRENGVCYWVDIDMTLYKWQMKNLPRYLDELVKDFKAKLEEVITQKEVNR